MPFFHRIAIVCLLLSLAACSSHSPTSGRSPALSAAQVEMANDVLFRALGLVGTPYRWGGNTPETGFDCSGLIGYVYHQAAGLRLPRSTRDMIAMRAPNVSRQSLQPGDLVFFATSGRRTVSHAGIYVGEGRFVHAPSSGGKVRLDHLSSQYWQKAYLNAKRVLASSSVAGLR